MHCIATPNLFASSFSCLCSSGVYHGIIFLVATNIYFSAYQLCRNRVFFVAIGFLLILSNFFCYKKLFSHDKLFFSDSCHLLRCLSRHRIICCDTIALAILSSSSISVAAYFFPIAIEFYHSIAFIVTIEIFFVAIENLFVAT